MKRYVGLDVHKQTCHATVMDSRGKVVKSGKFQNEPKGFEEFFDDISDAEVAMEASYCWQPAYELLEGMGYKVKLAHPLKTRIIAEARIKTGVRDSEALAHLLRADLLPESHVPSKEARELRDLVRLRTYLVRERTRLKSKIRAELAKRGISIEGNPFTRRGRAQLTELGMESVNSCLAVMSAVDERIRKLSGEVERRAEKSEDAKLLMTIPGVGHFSALLVLAEIDDISRFGDAEKLCSYAGLVPSTHQSGNVAYHGHITKQGSALLRWVLQESVWKHVQYDTRLAHFFRRLARKKGRKIAAVATARKMLVGIHSMLTTGEVFHD
ncbi:MAG: IS110 family transposase [Candidatus Zixiibacteriota bacterium]